VGWPEYSDVWTPTHVAYGWAPYSFGRWVWVSPWGYTWIDNAPGLRAVSYGRWAYVSNRWSGAQLRHVRAVYAPALWVGRFAWRKCFLVSARSREVYVPSHRYSRHYVERVNVSNTIVNRMFISQAMTITARTSSKSRAPGGVTTALRAAFAGRIAGRVVRTDNPEWHKLGEYRRAAVRTQPRGPPWRDDAHNPAAPAVGR
jgi:hypothetical protein